AGARERRRLDLAVRRRLAAPERLDVAAPGARRDGRGARAQPGAEGARLQVRGADDLLRVHAGDGDGERSHDGLLPMASGPATREERTMRLAVAVLTLLLTAAVAAAGGSNYGIAPGARAQGEGRMSEWAVPPPQRAHGPRTGKVVEHKAPSGGDPHTLVIDEQGILWFTVQSGNRIGRLDTRTGAFAEYKARGRPYGLTLDRAGNVWFCEIAGDRLGRLDPKTGTITELPLERGSQPRRMATAPDGSLWVTLYRSGTLVRVDPATQKVLKEYALPAGERGGPYAVTIDGAGVVWANEIQTDTVVRLDPGTGALRVFALPSKDV